MRRIRNIIVCLCLILVAVYSLANFEWYYYVWDTKYYEKVQDAYLTQFPQAREVSVENNHLVTITIKSVDYFSLPYALVYVNKHQISDLRDGQITLIVNNGDKIYIDSSYYNTEIDVEVVATTGNIVEPLLGEKITLLPQRNCIANVKIDHTE